MDKPKLQSKGIQGAILVAVGGAGMALANYYGYPQFVDIISQMVAYVGAAWGIYGIRDAQQ